jgi:hypothetical protein
MGIIFYRVSSFMVYRLSGFIEHQQDKNSGEIDDRSGEQLPGRGIRSAKSKARAVVTEDGARDKSAC